MTSGAGLVRTAAGLLYATAQVRRGSLPRPIDAPVVRAGSGDAVRVLLVANGPLHGWGVGSHELAATGVLARRLAAALGGAAEVELVGDSTMNAATTALWLDGRVDRSFDAAVLAIGANDAERLVPVAEWRARIAELLDLLRDGLPPGAPVLLVGVPAVTTTVERMRRMGAITARHARRLDAAAAAAAAAVEAVIVVPAPDAGAVVGLPPGPAVHEGLVAPIVEPLARALTTHRVVPTAQPREETFEHRETQAVVEAARAGALAALEEITARARERFRVMESAVTFVDGDRTWHLAHGGLSPVQVPRSLTYCETVAATAEPLVVEDSARDPRFADSTFLDEQQARFYAGAPIRSAEGVTIGALCLLHAFPRSADRIDLDALRELAMEVEAIVQATTAARFTSAAPTPAG